MATMTTASLTTRLDSQLKSELEEIARLENRSTSYMANQAIRNLVEERQATRELLQTGLKMIEQGVGGISPQAMHDWFMTDGEDFPESSSAN